MNTFKPLLVGACAALFSFGAFAQTNQVPTTNGAGTNDPCRMMMQMHQQMRERIRTSDQELQQLVNEMNGAPVSSKIDAIAAVVNKLAQDRLMMHQLIGENMRTMRHMMQHMGTNALQQCPCWKAMMQEPQENGTATPPSPGNQ